MWARRSSRTWGGGTLRRHRQRGDIDLLVVVGDAGRVLGIFTDGDLRRAFEKHIDLQSARIDSVMHANPRTIAPDRLAVEAVEMMERYRINALLVADADGRLLGALNMHDLFTARVAPSLAAGQALRETATLFRLDGSRF